MRHRLSVLLFAVALTAPCLLLDAPVNAQPPRGGAGRPPPPASHDPAAAAAGTYKLDPNHASIIVRILHEGTSYSTFRFNSDAGTLDWTPANIEGSKVDVTVDTKSIATPVAGFNERLTGQPYLNSAQFPQARFVSTSIRRTGPTTGEITGDLTLLGVTKPITVKAELVGVGSNARGIPSIGFEGSARFKRSDFGLTILPGVIGDEVELVLDLAFDRQG